ncbi:hypothetical protein [Amycolatopsis speibonae]|uniref:SGNH hydrolase-type esterase domain-containing protein n=1 Tax=Amycolatopsis speibonae TaxID=1450224 RepID=A0ABV7P8C1_9PSEU
MPSTRSGRRGRRGHLTGFKLFHNHMAVEPVLGIFPFGSPPSGRLVNEFRRRVIEEAADADLPGLVYTNVWGHLRVDNTHLSPAETAGLIPRWMPQ